MQLTKRLYYLAHGDNPEQLMDKVNLLWDNGNGGELIGTAFAVFQSSYLPIFTQQMILSNMPAEHVPCSKEQAIKHIMACLDIVQKKFGDYFKERVHYSRLDHYAVAYSDAESVASPGPVIFAFVKELRGVFHNIPEGMRLELDVCNIEQVYTVLHTRLSELLVKSPVYQEVQDAIGMNL